MRSRVVYENSIFIITRANKSSWIEWKFTCMSIHAFSWNSPIFTNEKTCSHFTIYSYQIDSKFRYENINICIEKAKIYSNLEKTVLSHNSQIHTFIYQSSTETFRVFPERRKSRSHPPWWIVAVGKL